jgi:hypothetical protein
MNRAPHPEELAIVEFIALVFVVIVGFVIVQALYG